MLSERLLWLNLASFDISIRDNAGKGKSRGDSCALSIGVNFEGASEFPDTFPHPAKPHSRVRTHGKGKTILQGYPSTFIADLNDKLLFRGKPNLDTGRFASGMAVDVGEALLNDPENRNFDIGGQAANFGREVHVHLYVTAFGKASCERLNRGHKADFVKKRRVKEMRNRANLLRQLFDKESVLAENVGSLWAELIRLPESHTVVHGECGDDLSHAIVEVAGDAPALFILCGNQAGGKVAKFTVQMVHLARFAMEVREDAYLRAQQFGNDRDGDVIHGAALVSLEAGPSP